MKWLGYLATPVFLILSGVAFYSLYFHKAGICELCHRPLHHETAYSIHLSDGEKVDVCCARCGLHFERGKENVRGSQVADYYTGRRLDASAAYFVENSSVHPCAEAMLQKDRSGRQYSLTWDRCMPSLIAFHSRETAEQFQHEKGGHVRTYQELTAQDF